MSRMILLDGVPIALDVDKVEIDLKQSGRQPSDHCGWLNEPGGVDGESWQALMSFEDGSTLYLHCPAEGTLAPLGYRVEGPRPHRWNITLLPQGDERVARLSWEAC